MDAAARKSRRGDRLALGAIIASTAALAAYLLVHLIRRLGHPGAALDDSYIHFQYARAFVELHPFRFTPGAPRSSGGTSFAWPLALAIPYGLGLRGEAILWGAWGYSFAALAGLAWEARMLTRRLAGDTAANGIAFVVVFFPAFGWFAASGMEVVPFAWLLARAVRRAAEWAEADGTDAANAVTTAAPITTAAATTTTTIERTRARGIELLVLGWVLPLARPEGAVITLALAATRLFFPANAALSKWRSRVLPALAIAVAAAVPTLVLLATTGQATSSTAQVKLLSSDPYLSKSQLFDSIWENVRLVFSNLLNGGPWSDEFLPQNGVGVAVAGIAAMLYLSKRTRSLWRGALLVVLAACLLAPATYVTFLWNRLRYLWPFASAWLVGVACLATLFGEYVAALAPKKATRHGQVGATILVLAGFAFPLLRRLPGALDDEIASASGIDRQQVDLGHWVHDHLDTSAVVGLNDTGAIAYFGDHRTFDVVGLTTPGEARYWVAGAASRFEHYEHLFNDDPARLPTHFAVYPNWLGCDMLRGRTLAERTVTDSTILGGPMMGLYQADYSTLGSGEKPWTVTSVPGATAVVTDEVDVADLESEAAHGYDLAGAEDEWQVVNDGLSPATETTAGMRTVDGGRAYRKVERFTVHLDGAAFGIARVASAAVAHATVRVDGSAVAGFDVAPGAWSERVYALPRSAGSTRIEIDFDAPVAVFHHWFVGDKAEAAPAR